MAPPRRPRIPEVPPQLGACRDLRFLAHGAMGAVFRGRHTRLGRDVAVKVVHPRGAADPVLLQRFVREVKLLIKVDHPHVVNVLEAGREGDLAYVVMELIEGESLEDLLARQPHTRLPPADAAFYLRQVAEGLGAVHACGIVHRDLKPANVMIQADGRAVVADFGLARGADSTQLTQMDEVVGTPEYMAPEAIQQQEVDGRADLYALGITAYELLCGQTPFNQGGVMRVVADQVRREPMPILARNGAVPPGLAEVVHRLLAKDPAQRYATAAEAAQAFAPFAGPRPSPAAMAQPSAARAATPPPGAAAPARAAEGDPPAGGAPAGGGWGQAAAGGGRAGSGRQPAAPAAPAAPATDAGWPPWETLYLIKLLADHGVYPLETLVSGLEAWSREGAQVSFAAFLVRRAGLPEATGHKALEAARARLGGLRDRLAFSRAQQVVPAERLRALSSSPRPPGRSLPQALQEAGLLSPEQARALQASVERALRGGLEQALRAASQGQGAPPTADLSALRAQLPAPRFQAAYAQALQAVFQSI